MTRRTAATGMLVLLAWLVATAISVGAQTSATQTPAGADPGVVSVVLGDGVGPIADNGVLARTDKATAAPLVAVLVGLSVLGATLGVITHHRHAVHVRHIERTTGVVAGRRARTDFWGLPGAPRGRRPVPTTAAPSVVRAGRHAAYPAPRPSGSPARPTLPAGARPAASRPRVTSGAGAAAPGGPGETSASGRTSAPTRA